MSDVPLASYDDPRWMPTNENPLGTRGSTGTLAVLTTNTTIANTDLVITTKDCAYGNDPSIKVQYAILAPGAPQGLYEDGIPAIWSPLPTDLGFMVIMKRPGPQGNYFTLTLVNPGQPGPLKIVRPAAKNVVIRLAYATGAVTTTPAQLISAINGDPELSEYMTAFASSAGPATVPAFAQKAFTGGMDVPGLVLVSLVSSVAGASTATGLGVMNLLNGSRYVSAKPAAANTTNAGIVPAMPAITMTGPTAVGSIVAPTLTLGSANRGEVSDQYLARRSAWAKRRRAGDPLGKETNKTLQLRSSRLGTPRNYQRVPKQDRAVIASSFQNHTSDTLAAHMLG